MTDLHLLALSALLNWVMIVVAAVWGLGGFSRSALEREFGNRAEPHQPSPAAARAGRAAKNMSENMILLVAVLGAARLGGGNPRELATGTAIFFGARLAYWPVYVIGIPYLRTFVWATSVFGLLWIGVAGW